MGKGICTQALLFAHDKYNVFPFYHPSLVRKMGGPRKDTIFGLELDQKREKSENQSGGEKNLHAFRIERPPAQLDQHDVNYLSQITYVFAGDTSKPDAPSVGFSQLATSQCGCAGDWRGARRQNAGKEKANSQQETGVGGGDRRKGLCQPSHGLQAAGIHRLRVWGENLDQPHQEDHPGHDGAVGEVHQRQRPRDGLRLRLEAQGGPNHRQQIRCRRRRRKRGGGQSRGSRRHPRRIDPKRRIQESISSNRRLSNGELSPLGGHPERTYYSNPDLLFFTLKFLTKQNEP